MAHDDKKAGELDVLALLAEVHGSELNDRSTAVDVALKTLERTHRQASLAMRQFERSGRAAGQDTGLDAEPNHVRTTPGSGSAAPAPTANQAPPQAEPAAPKVSREEVTAVWRPPAAAAAPSAKAAGATVVVPAEAAPAEGKVYAGQGAQVILREPTKTRILPRPRKK